MDTVLGHFLLESDESEQKKPFSDVVEDLAQNKDQIKLVWTDDVSRNLMVTSASEVVARLIILFQSLSAPRKFSVQKVNFARTYHQVGEIASDILNELVMPLFMGVEDYIYQESLLPFSELVISIFQFFTNKPIPSKVNITRLVQTVSRKPHLLETILMTTDGCKALGQLFQFGKCNVQTNAPKWFPPEVIQEWTDCIFAISRKCPNHGFLVKYEKWNDVKHLVASLDNAWKDADKSRERSIHTSEVSGLAPLHRLRKLGKDDKKSLGPVGSVHRFLLSQEDESILHKLDLALPKTEMQAFNTRDHLKNGVAWTIFYSIFSTFPCKTCQIMSKKGNHLNDFSEILEEDRVFNFEVKDEKSEVGIWRIILTGHAMKDMAPLRRSGLFPEVEKTLRDIATGDWSHRSSLTRRYVYPNLPLPVVKAYYSTNGFILWNIALALNSLNGVVSQVVKIWRIGSNKEVEQSMDEIYKVLKTYDSQVVRECKTRNFSDKLNVFIPKESSPEILKIDHKNDTNTVTWTRDESLSLHQAIVTGKTYALTESLLGALSSDCADFEVPFELSARETQIVKHCETAAFIIGRSGTGKTSCLIFRLFTRYMMTETLQLGKQIFITRSPVLSQKIKNYVDKLIIACQPKEQQTSALDNQLELDESTIFDLKERSKPVVCTFSQLMDMIERTLSSNSDSLIEKYGNISGRDPEVTPKTQAQRPGKRIEYQDFKNEYWEKLPSGLKKNLEPDLVFSEILGTVKGSNVSISESRDLSRDEYLSKSTRQSSFFQEEKDRTRIYQIFLSYERLKTAFRDQDGIDRARSMLIEIKENRYLLEQIRQIISEVYVDEAQDIKLIELHILFNLVSDPLGITLAGDTAQCISRDSTFRFEDIKMSFYEHFSPFSSFSGNKRAAVPNLFPLSENYRSHQGILGLASLLTTYLSKLFPETIDKLPEEVGKFNGPAPVLFAGVKRSELRRIRFSEEESESLTNVSAEPIFGAHQVVLVPDKQDMEIKKELFGEDILLLSILQSKGLEFEDVLLFNFFTEGNPRISKSLRALLTIARSGSELDKSKHAGLCAELKSLYVAVTRAQSKLWIFEEDAEVAEIFAEICSLGDKPLIEIVRADDLDVKPSLKEILANELQCDLGAWENRGHEMLAKCEYNIALRCFKKAKSEKWQAAASAYIAKGDVARKWTADPPAARQRLDDAIQLFSQAELLGEAAKMCEDWGEFLKSAEIWLEIGQIDRSARNYVKCGNYLKASNLYHDCKKYNESATVLRQANLIRNKRNLNPDLYDTYSHLCYVLYRKKLLTHTSVEKVIAGFGTDEEKEEFYKQQNIHDELIMLYVEQKRFSEAWDILVGMNRFEEALRICSIDQLIESKGEAEVRKILHFNFANNFFKLLPAPDLNVEAFDWSKLTPNPSWTSENVLFANILSDWHEIIRLIKTWVRVGGIVSPAAKNKLEHGLLREFFDLLMLRFTPAILYKANKTAHIPMESLVSSIDTIKKLVIFQQIPASVQLFCGMFEVKAQNFNLLFWCPIVGDGNKIQNLSQYLVQLVVENCFLALEKVDSIRPRRLCFSYAARGTCKRENCTKGHRAYPNTNEFDKEIKDDHNSAKLACNLLFFQYQNVIEDNIKMKFRPHERKWLENYLRKITFFSMVTQLPYQDVVNRGVINNDQCILWRLEEMLFYRLRPQHINKEGEARQDILSDLLEVAQLAEFLGPRVLYRFNQWLQWKFYHSQQNPKLLQTITFTSGIMQMLWNLKSDSVDNIEQVFSILKRIATLDPHEHYRSFETIAWIFDKILRVNFDDLILPRSWISRFGLSQSRRLCRREPSLMIAYLKRLMLALFELHTTFSIVDLDPERPWFMLTYSGRSAPYNKIFMFRRIFDSFLVVFANVAVLNLQANSQYQNDINSMKILASSANVHLNLPGLNYLTNYRIWIIREFNSAFEKYGDKDCLVILKAGMTKVSKAEHLLNLAGLRLPTVSVSANPATTTPSRENVPDEKADEITAARKIFHIWQRRKEKYYWFKYFKQSQAGQAYEAVELLLRMSVLDGKSVKITRAHGPRVYTIITEAIDGLVKLQNKTGEIINDSETGITHFEVLNKTQKDARATLSTLKKQSIFHGKVLMKSHKDVERELVKLMNLGKKALKMVEDSKEIVNKYS